MICYAMHVYAMPAYGVTLCNAWSIIIRYPSTYTAYSPIHAPTLPIHPPTHPHCLFTHPRTYTADAHCVQLHDGP